MPISPPHTRADGGRTADTQRQIVAREVVVALTDGRFDFGPWEQIFWASRNGWPASLGGRRRKRVLVKIIGE